MTQIILKPESKIYQVFQQLIIDADRVFFAGLPGVGKSLMLQQLTLMAQKAGREVHLLQWDTTRPAFETSDVLVKYPLIDGATHPMIIKAAGIWVRQGVSEWDETHIKPHYMLIGEVPLIGDRLMEIVRSYDDKAESMLNDERTQFVVPVPSKAVREVIEASREKTIANPQHENENQDAPPNLLRALWHNLYRIAGELGLTELQAENVPYSPEIYSAVYRHLLQHRNYQILAINEALKPSGSAYDFDRALPQLIATTEQARQILSELGSKFTAEQVQANAERWYEV